jgi:ABC-2 type transport system permease protein
LRDLDNTWLVALCDPFGLRALGLERRYWSTAELNTQLPSLFGYIGANRVLWLFVSFALLAWALRQFSPTARVSGKAQKAPVTEAPIAIAQGARPKPSGTSKLQLFWHLVKLDTKFVLSGLAFLVMLGFGLINFWGAAEGLTEVPNATTYPVTYIMVDAIAGGMQWLLAIVVAFYGGELVWRARSVKMHEMLDATPIDNFTPLLAKSGSVIAVVLDFTFIGLLAGMVYQLLQGYTRFELPVYLSGLLLSSMPFILIGLLSIALQVITGNKFLGYGAILLVFISQIVMAFLDLTHNLYQFGGSPRAVYSDLNGWGQALKGVFAFSAYWLAFVMLLMVIAAAMQSRGVFASFSERMKIAGHNLRGSLGVLAAACAALSLGLGAWLYYQSTVVNVFRSPDQQTDLRVAYEQKYQKYQTEKQPRVIASKLNIELYPSEKRMQAQGVMTLFNRESVPITQLIVQEPEDAKIALQLPAHKVSLNDEQMKFRIYQLDTPLAPGAQFELPFTSEIHARGIRNAGEYTSIVDNGSFFNNGDFMPRFGYNRRAEITDPNERRKRKLAPARRMPPLEDQAARANTYLGDDSDWIDFDITVGTDAHQVALAPGYLQREWRADGRRYFHYKMDRPILNFYSIMSANWTITKGEWKGSNGTDGLVSVPIEIYHHPAHTYNVQTMIDSVKQSLDYFTTNFSPYQHKQVRIIEFPRYASFAQAFPNTIPYSEAIGFIADTRKSSAINYPFYVTAHEIAHQWWAHQVIGGAVQGSTMLSESLSQYSALMVMQKVLGKDKMRQFLKYELDQYLRGRSTERLKELPLYRVENQQYLHYNKGSLAFYRLQDEIGETVVNQALKNYIAKVAYQQAPFTVSTDLIAEIRALAKPEQQQLISDLFEKIGFYDNRVESAVVKKLDNGKFEVTLNLLAKKLYSDGVGKESATKIDDFIDVGVFAKKVGDEEPRVLYLRKHRITQERPVITVTVDELPAEVGFDPYNKLIDRVSGDNRKAVSQR